MKKSTKKLALRSETIRVLNPSTLTQVVGGSVVGTSVISQSSGTSIISIGTSQSSGTSVISIGGGR